jgi:hypothetical protein
LIYIKADTFFAPYSVLSGKTGTSRLARCPKNCVPESRGNRAVSYWNDTGGQMVLLQTPSVEIRSVAEPFSRRADAATASIVNQAILFQERIGTDYAAAYLNCKGVNVDIAIRVLSRPKERRRY